MSAAAAPPGEEGAAAGEGRGRAPSTTRAKAGSGGSGPAPAPLLHAEARGRAGGGRRRLQAMPRMGPAGRARGGRLQLGPVAASFAEGPAHGRRQLGPVARAFLEEEERRKRRERRMTLGPTDGVNLTSISYPNSSNQTKIKGWSQSIPTKTTKHEEG